MLQNGWFIVMMVIYMIHGQDQSVNVRMGHTANLVEGKILLFGGYETEDIWFNDLSELILESMEWNVPVSTGDIPDPRGGHSSVTIFSQNSLLIFGGERESRKFGVTSRTVYSDLYKLNYKNYYWEFIQATGQAPSARFNHAAVLVKEYMFIFGGSDDSKQFNDLYRLNTDNWEWEFINTRGNLPLPRSSHSMVHYNNLLLIFGGKLGDKVLDDIHILDLETFIWRQPEMNLDNSPTPRYGHTMSVFTDELNVPKLILYGGIKPNGACDNIMWVYLPQSNLWYQTGLQLPSKSRALHTISIYLDQGRWTALILGGLDCETNQAHVLYFFKLDLLFIDSPDSLLISEPEITDPSQLRIKATQLSTLTYPLPVFGHGAVKVSSKEVLIFGGKVQAVLNSWNKQVFLYQPALDNMIEISSRSLSPESIAHFTATYLPSAGEVVVFGGELRGYFSSPATDKMYIISLESNPRVWKKVDDGGTTPSPRLGHSGVLIKSLDREEIFIFGGENKGKPFNDLYILYRQEIVSRNSFSSLLSNLLSSSTHQYFWKRIDEQYGSIPTPRSFHCSISDGRFMWVFGGHDPSEDLYSNDLYSYDPSTVIWQNHIPETLSQIPLPRKGHACAYINNHLVVFGGKDNSGYMDDLWMVELNTKSRSIGEWKPLLQITTIQARAFMAYVGINNALYIFGGMGKQKEINDAWEIVFPDDMFGDQIGMGMGNQICNGPYCATQGSYKEIQTEKIPPQPSFSKQQQENFEPRKNTLSEKLEPPPPPPETKTLPIIDVPELPDIQSGSPPPRDNIPPSNFQLSGEDLVVSSKSYLKIISAYLAEATETTKKSPIKSFDSSIWNSFINRNKPILENRFTIITALLELLSEDIKQTQDYLRVISDMENKKNSADSRVDLLKKNQGILNKNIKILEEKSEYIRVLLELQNETAQKINELKPNELSPLQENKEKLDQLNEKSVKITIEITEISETSAEIETTIRLIIERLNQYENTLKTLPNDIGEIMERKVKFDGQLNQLTTNKIQISERTKELETKKKQSERKEQILSKKVTALQEYIEESSELSVHAKKLTELKRILLMSDLGEDSGEIEEAASDDEFIRRLSNEIQEQRKTVSETLIKFIQDLDKSNEEKRALDIEIIKIEDNLKTIDLLLKNKNQELSEQQNKYDKLVTEKKLKQDQLEEVVAKLNNLLETKKVFTQDINSIKSILPQLEKDEDIKKNTLANLIEKQKDTETQISKFFTETKALYTKLEADKEAAISEERKLIEYWFALDNTFRKMEEQVEPFLDKPIPQPPKSFKNY